MTLTTSERLTVDGMDLKTLACNIESLGALLTGAARRGSNTPTAGRSGSLWSGSKPHEEGSFVLKGWIIGTNEDGRIPTGSTRRREFYDRVDELAAVFGGSGLIRFVHTLPDGSQRRCDAEVRDAFSMETFGADPTGQWTISCEIPGSFWEDNSSLSATSAGDITSKFSGATAPMEDGAFKILGPVNNPTIIDAVSGARFRYDLGLTSSQSLTVNSDNWQLTSSGGLAIDYRRVTMSGTNGRFMRLEPRKGGSRGYSATLTGTGGSNGTLQLAGRRKYMNG